MNLKKAIADWIINNPDLQPIIGDRVYRNKATITDQTPFIVYSFDRVVNQWAWWNNNHHYLGYSVILDVVWKYEEQEQMEFVRDYLIKKWNGFSWELTSDWSWIIWLREFVDLYDDKTDLLVYRVEFLFKEVI